jgi:GNAT superfamily N-acetyltransferase
VSERRSPRQIASGARRLIRVGGLRAVAGGVVADTVYRRLALFERPLPGASARPGRQGLDFRFLDAGDLPAYGALCSGERDLAARRLSDGSRCLGTWLEGELVSVRWVASGRSTIAHLGSPLPLRPGEVHSFDSYTSPAHRRQGISSASQEHLFQVLAEEGYERIIRAILPENRPAVRDPLRSGYRRTGTIGYIRLGPWRRPFLRRREL